MVFLSRFCALVRTESIAGPAYGLDHLPMLAEGFAESADVHVNRAILNVGVGPPDLIQ